ncbi:tyrosine-type recombinase/integrase [Planomonospora sp. ID91781]|uniref:tyrosine-type recombinase/integrase n=1 Tax=Planomonospora sp. ID91781 TaxID=2738135 RepID=UPI0018C3CC70|nr:tyrosine-type recombinase/integrase [Planomonospora sp. ID91781]MBG0819339.1 tyrosine-type recombinase/integrase [Planomonospora sp. ID91781]
MNTTYDVKFWEIQRRKDRKTLSFLVRWTVDRKAKSKSFRTKGLAESFLSDLRQAAKAGEASDVTAGLPLSMLAAEQPAGPTFLEFAQTYVLSRWRTSAARTRETDVYGLLSLVADLPNRPADGDMRELLRSHALLPVDRRPELPHALVSVLAWLQKASLPLADLQDPRVVRAALDAISVTFTGKDAAANTVRRKREVLHHLLELAVEQKELSANPLQAVKWTPPKAAATIDPRTVVNPEQARALLAAVPTVGRTRGGRLHGMFACMYYAALRPEEAAGLRRQNCDIPEEGWGLLTVEKERPQANKRWTNSGETHDSRGLKHRAKDDTREIPIPPVLVAVLRAHIDRYGVAGDGGLFRTSKGRPFSSSAYSAVWQESRRRALTAEQVASPLAARPYDLRHAAVSLWLNAGVPATEVAKRAGHSVDVLLRVYAKCIEGQRTRANRKISEALEE